MTTFLYVVKCLIRSLFDYRWSWFEGAHVDGVDNLVKTMLKFAQEIDTGTISCVNFEMPSVTGPSSAMQMLCQRDRQVIATLFHCPPISENISESVGIMSNEDTIQQTRILLEQIRESFVRRYSARLDELRGRSTGAWDMQDDEGNSNSLIAPIALEENEENRDSPERELEKSPSVETRDAAEEGSRVCRDQEYDQEENSAKQMEVDEYGGNSGEDKDKAIYECYDSETAGEKTRNDFTDFSRTLLDICAEFSPLEKLGGKQESDIYLKDQLQTHSHRQHLK